MLTEHAKERMKQRGFRHEHIEFIVRHGSKKRVGAAVRYSITKGAAKKLELRGFRKDLIEKCKSTYVVSAEGIVITIAHMH